MTLPYSFGEGTQLDKLFLTQLQIDLAALDASITANSAAITALQTAVATIKTGLFESGLIKQPQNQDYRIVERFPFAGTIDRFTVKLASGTCTVNLTINGVVVGNCSIPVTSTQATTVTAAPKTLAVADVIALTISANSNAVDLSWQFDYSRT